VISWRCLIQLVLRIASIHIKNKLHSLDTNKLHVTPRSKPKCIFDNLYILRNFINGIMAKYQLLQPSSTSPKIYSKVHTCECTSCNKCLKIKTRASPESDFSFRHTVLFRHLILQNKLFVPQPPP